MADNRIAFEGKKSSSLGLKCGFRSMTLIVLAAVLFFPVLSAADDGQFTLFLNGPLQSITDITFTIDAVSIVDEDGVSRQVSESSIKVSSAEVVGRQLLVGETDLPEGKYTTLRLLIKDASLSTGKKSADLANPEGPVDLPITIRIQRGQNVTLFIHWDADSSVKDGYLFRPSFAITGAVPELLPLLIFVSNEGSNNVSVINRQDDEVVATIKTGKNPTGIAAGQDVERLRVYVANTGSDSISVINPAENRVEQEVAIRFGREPQGIAVSEVYRGRELVFVANRGSNTVSVVDTRSFEEVDKIQVGNGPVALAVDPPVESFLVSRYLSASDIDLLRNFRESFVNVYVANKNSREISVLRWDIKGNRFDTHVVPISVDWTPIDLSVDAQRGKVYVTNYDSDKLSILDMVQLANGNTASALTTISNLGSTSTGVVADPQMDRIYLLNESSSKIILVRPLREVPRVQEPTLSPIVGTISVGKKPRSLIIDTEGRKLYVVNRGDNTLTVIDRTTRKEEKIIPVGKMPYGITMFSQF